MKNKVTFINMLSGLFLQACTIISGFILPRIILNNFGSDVNGLVASITQFLSYISLVEGGVGAVVVANLYKPLVNRNNDEISVVIKTANKFYKSISIIFIVYSILLSVIYPLLFDTVFSFEYIGTLTIIIAIGTTVQYMFAINMRNLLNADKKAYIVNIIQGLTVIMNLILSIITVSLVPNIHLIKFITVVLYCIQPIVFKFYIDSHYAIDKNALVDDLLLKERWNGFAINTAAFVHNCTDIAVLTIFTDLKTVSVYSVYALVVNGIKQLLQSLYSGINPTIGHAYALGNNEKINEKMNLYEFVVLFSASIFFTLTALLITPFVMAYTKGITDANYYQPAFGLLFVISEAIYLVKMPHLNLAYVANKFKEITFPAYIEAALNITISVILVFKYGLIGVSIGTIVAMLYRMIFHVYYTEKLIKGRKQSVFYRKLIVIIAVTFVSYLLCVSVAPISNYEIVTWTIHALIYGIIIMLLNVICAFLFFKAELKYCINYLRKNK